MRPPVPTPAPPRSADYRVGVGGRIAAGVIAAACLAVLVTASCLKPNPDGSGTHQQLGFEQCGWITAFNKPCFTCGMTTAFAHAAHGSYLRGFLAQPCGFLMAVIAAAAVWVGGYVAATGSRAGRICAGLLAPPLLWCYAIAGGAAWAYKVLTWPG